jgi:hypothetical protein
MEDVNDLDVLDVRDAISSIDGLEGIGSRRTLIGALEVFDEHGTQLVPGMNGSLR